MVEEFYTAVGCLIHNVVLKSRAVSKMQTFSFYTNLSQKVKEQVIECLKKTALPLERV